MRRSADDPENRHLRVYDLDATELRGVQWFDDETGEYEVALQDQNGRFIRRRAGGLLSETRKGGIVVRSEADPTFELTFPAVIEPAMTPEEWEDVEPVPADEGYDDAIYSLASPGLTLRGLHALAARALFGQPFGFTRADVELLRELATPQGDWYREDERLVDLADRIAALLPPEKSRSGDEQADPETISRRRENS